MILVWSVSSWVTGWVNSAALTIENLSFWSKAFTKLPTDLLRVFVQWLPDADTARTWPWDTLFMDECLSKMFVIDHIQCWHSLSLQEYLHFPLEYSVYRATIAAQQTYKKLVWISSLLFYILFRSLFYIYKSSIWHWCIARRVFQCSRFFL